MEKIVVEIIGGIAGGLVLLSYAFSNQRTLRIINIIASLIFMGYGILIAYISGWTNGWVTVGLNFSGIILHIIKIYKERKMINEN